MVKPKKVMKKKLPVIILMLFGAVFFTIALASVLNSVNLKKHGVQTESTVTDQRIRKGLASVTVTFNTNDGTLVTAKASKRSSVKKG